MRWSTITQLLLASYTFSGGQNRFSKFVQSFYVLGGGQNGLSELLQASYAFEGTLKFYKPPKR